MHLLLLSFLAGVVLAQTPPVQPVDGTSSRHLVNWEIGVRLQGCQFSPDSKHFAAMCDISNTESRLMVWKVPEQQPLHTWNMPYRDIKEFRWLNTRGWEEYNVVQFTSPTTIVVTAVSPVKPIITEPEKPENPCIFIFHVTQVDLVTQEIKHHQFPLTAPSRYSWCSFNFASHSPVVLACVSSPDEPDRRASGRGCYWQRIDLVKRAVDKTGYFDTAFPKHYGFYPMNISPDGSTVMLRAGQHGKKDGSGRLPVGFLYRLDNGEQSSEVLFPEKLGSDDPRGQFSPDGKLAWWDDGQKLQWLDTRKPQEVHSWNYPAFNEKRKVSRSFFLLNSIERVVEYTSSFYPGDASMNARRPPVNTETGSGPAKDGLPSGWTIWAPGQKEPRYLPLFFYNGPSQVVYSPDGRYVAQMMFFKKKKQLINMDVYELKP